MTTYIHIRQSMTGTRPDMMTPLVRKLEFKQVELMVTDDGKSETLIGIAGKYAYVSHNMGISWERIDSVSNYKLRIMPKYNEMHIIGDDLGYFLDSEGKVFKEVRLPSYFSILSVDMLSRHPKNPNAILACCTGHTCFDECGFDDRKWCFYTKDGGANWEAMESNEDVDPYIDGPKFEFVGSGASDLIYKYEEYEDWTEYCLNFFSESPLEFNKLPSAVYKLPYRASQDQDVFFQLKDLKELYVSKDGVNFEHMKFPGSYPDSTRCKIHGGMTVFGFGTFQFTDERFRGSLFLQKLYPPVRPCEVKFDSWLPWTTLFRYDVKSNAIKLMMEYCYDLTVVSAPEGIIIANIVTNPYEYLHKDAEPVIKTVITYDDGGNWEPIKGPSGTKLSIANYTRRNCFKEDNDQKPSVPGLLIVHGKEGPIEHYLSESNLKYDSKFYSSLSTYITKDSGRTWRKINDNMLDWTIGGKGDIIILHLTPLEDYILYSLDGGEMWHKLELNLPQEMIVATPPYRCESKRFLLQDSRGPPNCYYSLSFDPADQYGLQSQ